VVRRSRRGDEEDTAEWQEDFDRVTRKLRWSGDEVTRVRWSRDEVTTEWRGGYGRLARIRLSGEEFTSK